MIATTRQSTPGENLTFGRSEVAPTLSPRIGELERSEISFVPNTGFRKISPESAEEGCQMLLKSLSEKATTDGSASPGLPSHLARMCETPLLSVDHERAIFKWMNYYKFRANSLRARLSREPELADEVEASIAMANRLRNHIVQANTRLVMSIARKFADNRNPFDDLLSKGLASLMHAVEKFDFDRGYRFSTYATCAVRRDLYRMVMASKKHQVRFNSGTAEVLEAHADDSDAQQHPTEAEWKTLSRSVSEILSDLDEREALIVSYRFGFTGSGKRQSYSTLGRKLGISKERVRQLANRALDKLRKAATDRKLDALLAT